MGKGSLHRKVNWDKFSDGYENIWGEGHRLETLKRRHGQLEHWIEEMEREKEELEKLIKGPVV